MPRNFFGIALVGLSLGIVFVFLADAPPTGAVPATGPATRPTAPQTRPSQPRRELYFFDGINIVEVTEDQSGIAMVVTYRDESGVNIVNKYKARSARELEKTSPAAYLLYQKALANAARADTLPSKR